MPRSLLRLSCISGGAASSPALFFSSRSGREPDPPKCLGACPEDSLRGSLCAVFAGSRRSARGGCRCAGFHCGDDLDRNGRTARHLRGGGEWRDRDGRCLGRRRERGGSGSGGVGCRMARGNEDCGNHGEDSVHDEYLPERTIGLPPPISNPFRGRFSNSHFDLNGEGDFPWRVSVLA